MKVISHRGNLNGRNPALENSPAYIEQAIACGFDVEIDLWMIDGKLSLGHDEPQYQIDPSFFNKNLWVHCKNIEAAQYASTIDINWFWHDTDKMTLTSKGHIWCFPNVYLKNGITVMRHYAQDLPDIKGICTDYPLKYSQWIRACAKP